MISRAGCGKSSTGLQNKSIVSSAFLFKPVIRVLLHVVKR